MAKILEIVVIYTKIYIIVTRGIEGKIERMVGIMAVYAITRLQQLAILAPILVIPSFWPFYC